MAFQVNWLKSAQARLAEIWIEAPDRAAIAEAAREVDRQLRTAPLEFGEQRSGSLRLGIVPPLAVMVEVFTDDLRVDVVGVKRLGARR